MKPAPFLKMSRCLSGYGRHHVGRISIKMVLVRILIMVQLSSSVSALLRMNHPLHEVVNKVNENGGPYIGLVMADKTEQRALQSSGIFIPNSTVPYVSLSGRRFNIGSIRGVNVIHVMSGRRRLNAGITVQILLDVFDIRGIVHYGTAGSSNNSLSFGSVSILKYVAFTGSWTWEEFESEETEVAEAVLRIGNFNLPESGENLLAEIHFNKEEFYSEGKPMQKVFWLEVDPIWFSLASQLQDLTLQQCFYETNETYCLDETPQVVYGLKGSTADIFVGNAAYREFLFDKLEVSTVDEESAAILMTAMSTGVPCIVFRGVSDLAGGGGNISSSLSSLAAINTVYVAVQYIELIGKQDPSINSK